MPVPTTQEAIAASVAVARALGLPTGDPVVIADGYSVRVHLRPAPVVTRVVTRGRLLRGDPLPWLRREVAVARWLADSGAPVVPPWSDPGPHRGAGHDVSLWTYLPDTGRTVEPAAFGALVGELHAVAAGYPHPLPRLVGPLTDIAAARLRSNDSLLHAAADAVLPLVAVMPGRPLHGDAHTGNVLMTPDGPRWLDFEDVCLGPVEWDLASRTVTSAAVAAYPGAVDAGRLAVLRDLRRLQTLAGVLTDDVQDRRLHQELAAALRQRL